MFHVASVEGFEWQLGFERVQIGSQNFTYHAFVIRPSGEERVVSFYPPFLKTLHDELHDEVTPMTAEEELQCLQLLAEFGRMFIIHGRLPSQASDIPDQTLAKWYQANVGFSSPLSRWLEGMELFPFELVDMGRETIHSIPDITPEQLTMLREFRSRLGLVK